MTKRIVSLFMAVMLAIGVFAVPALAAQEDDGIMPHGPMCYCVRAEDGEYPVLSFCIIRETFMR